MVFLKGTSRLILKMFNEWCKLKWSSRRQQFHTKSKKSNDNAKQMSNSIQMNFFFRFHTCVFARLQSSEMFNVGSYLARAMDILDISFRVCSVLERQMIPNTDRMPQSLAKAYCSTYIKAILIIAYVCWEKCIVLSVQLDRNE